MRSLLVASAAFSTGSVFMKPSNGFTRLLPSAAVLGCFLIGSIFLTLAVERGNLSSTYVLGLGLEALVAAGVGVFVLRERLTTGQGVGLTLVLIGLVLLRR